MPVSVYLVIAAIFGIVGFSFIIKAAYTRVRYHGRFDTVDDQIRGCGALVFCGLFFIAYLG